MNYLFDKHFKTEFFHELCAKYGIQPATASLIKEDSNLIYDCGDSILRISHSDIRSASDMELELDWLDFLSQKNVPVVRIIPSLAHKKMEQVGEQEVYFTAVRFEKIKGSKINETTWNPTHFQKLGSLAGLIHRTSQAYRYKEQFTYSHWDELIECSYITILPKDERELQQLTEDLVTEFRSYSRDRHEYGLIHNDIHHENYLLTGQENKIVLFDFEVACQSWYLYEIATALYYACLVNRKRNDEEFEQVFINNFIKGYRKEYDLPAVDFDTILKFMLYRDLFLHGYITKIWQHKESPHEIIDYLSHIDKSIEIRRQRLGM